MAIKRRVLDPEPVEGLDAYAGAGLDALAMEWMPRITRAQSMDILSSQSNLAGYKAVIDAVNSTLLPAIQNQELKDLVTKVAPAFKAHMDHAQSLLSAMK